MVEAKCLNCYRQRVKGKQLCIKHDLEEQSFLRWVDWEIKKAFRK